MKPCRACGGQVRQLEHHYQTSCLGCGRLESGDGIPDLKPAGSAAAAGPSTRRRLWKGAVGRKALKVATMLALGLVAATASHAKPAKPAYRAVLGTRWMLSFPIRPAFGPALVGPSLYDVVCTTAVATCGGASAAFSGGTVPNATTFSSTVTFNGTTSFASTNVFTGVTTFGTAQDAANAVMLNETANCITFEGTAADGNEGRLCGGNGGIDTTFTLTYLAANQTFVFAEGAQSITGNKDINNTSQGFVLTGLTFLRLGSSGSGHGLVGLFTAPTPDISVLGTGTLSNSFTVMEQADSATDVGNGSCGTVTCTHPQLNFQSATPGQTQYLSQAYFGTAGKALKTLTESSATSGFQLSIASGAGTGGTAEFTVFAADATDQQTLTGVLQFSGVNKAGTETCPTPTLTGTALNAVSAGTLTCTYAADTSPTNACNIQWNCVSSLTQTTLELYYKVNLVGPGQVTPQ